jgi:hypothetical protein
MLLTILIVLLIIWAIGGGAPMVNWGSGFGGQKIHFIWVIIIIILVLMLFGR